MKRWSNVVLIALLGFVAVGALVQRASAKDAGGAEIASVAGNFELFPAFEHSNTYLIYESVEGHVVDLSLEMKGKSRTLFVNNGSLPRYVSVAAWTPGDYDSTVYLWSNDRNHHAHHFLSGFFEVKGGEALHVETQDVEENATLNVRMAFYNSKP